MGLIEVIMIAVGLAMDAFAVSVCKGLAMSRVGLKEAATVGLWFGGFQALMPAIGYFLGTGFASYIEAFDHWVAFGLLVIIGLVVGYGLIIAGIALIPIWWACLAISIPAVSIAAIMFARGVKETKGANLDTIE